MIDRVTALIECLNIPAEVKAPLLAELRQVPEGARTVSGQNTTLYRACGVVKSFVAPEVAAEWICQYLYSLTVSVDWQTVKSSIRQNRNKTIELSPDVEPAELEVI